MSVNTRQLNIFWDANNRSNRFTNALMGRLFEDTSMEKELKMKYKTSAISKMEALETKRLQVKKEEAKKKHIMSIYKQIWNVKIKKKDIPVNRLEKLLCTKATK